jgi:FAD/FMN-containing dehydrogenase/Fe-S oxidoreductase
MTRVKPKSTLSLSEMHTVSPELQELAAALRPRLQGEIRFDGYSRMLYSTDASQYQIQPLGVVIPRHLDDVQATMEIAARHNIPILPRGGGSSLAGQTVGPALVVDFSKYLNQFVAVDLEARTATSQPGLTVAGFNQAVAGHGLMLGPDPASANRATVGGSVGNNATGSHSILYGMMADNVVSVDVILSDGSRASFGPVDPDALPQKARRSGLEGRIYAEVPRIVQGVMPDILRRWPKHWRRASGYNLDRLAAALLPPAERGKLSYSSRFRPDVADPTHIDRFNLAQLITGSEGTLAVVTEITLGLVPRPARTALAIIHFDHLLDACTAVCDVLETAPSASELMDRHLMDLARAQPEWAKKMHFVDGDPAAVLLTEFYGDSEAELESKLDKLETLLRQRGWKGAIKRLLNPEQQADVWSVRKAGLNLLMSRRGDYKPVPGIEDVSVPPEQLAEYIGHILDYCQAQDGIPGVAIYAHASAGCLHVRPLLNLKTAQGVRLLEETAHFAADLAVRYGGAMSGEHGDGLARSPLNPRIFGPALYQALRDVKGVFDPENRMNPGKIVDAQPLTENLRFGPEYRTIELETIFDWGTDGGYAPAIEMCNGAGVCRKLGDGTMCPSFMATRDEQDSTRGRANALRNALAGRIPPEELYAPEMYQVMDLCLGCKACKSECPSAVDMAKIKAEFLVHYYRQNGLPLFNRLMGWLPDINRLLYRVAALVPVVPGLVNWALQTPPSRMVLKRIGVHPNRTLPRFADEPFSRWFQRRQQTPLPRPGKAAGKLEERSAEKSAAMEEKLVVFFNDTWAEFNYPQIGQAIVQVLQAAGYRVALADNHACCGRPLITGGQADKARRNVNHNVALLASYAAQGIPIVGAEPSCVLTMRDEYPALAADRRRASTLAENVFTFEEFVLREARAGRFSPDWRPDAGSVLLHGHCHQKAIVGNETSVAALRLAGYQVEVIPSGCCGMAGDFGYGLEHYEISRKIGEERLFPAVRSAPADRLIVASGVSCRQQIAHFTGRQPVHLAQALAMALRPAREASPIE